MAARQNGYKVPFYKMSWQLQYHFGNLLVAMLIILAIFQVEKGGTGTYWRVASLKCHESQWSVLICDWLRVLVFVKTEYMKEDQCKSFVQRNKGTFAFIRHLCICACKSRVDLWADSIEHARKSSTCLIDMVMRDQWTSSMDLVQNTWAGVGHWLLGDFLE